MGLGRRHTDLRSHTDRVGHGRGAAGWWWRRWALGSAALVLVAGCAVDGGSTRRGDHAALALLSSGSAAVGDDVFEVWVCHVPDDVADPLYLTGGARLDLVADDIAGRLDDNVPGYFADISGGRYRPSFTAGGEVTTTAEAGHQGCIDRALDASTDSADAVLVVADAEHDGSAAGGLAQAGTGCDCPANTSRRVVYVGASDFHPDWGDVPALDLLEHEIGHTLGLPHSGDATADVDAHTYTSALDVMSNSAAPRDVDPTRRHGPATIAANLLALGWLDPDTVAVVPPEGAEIALTPSNLGTDEAPLGAPAVPRTVGVVEVDEFRVVTVELLAATGYDDHLPRSGVAVHLVDQSPAVCGHTDGTACTGLDRHQVVVGSPTPHTDLLTTGEHLTIEGWTIGVTALADDGSAATASITPA